MAETVAAPAKSAPSVVPGNQTATKPVSKPPVVTASVAGDAEGTHDEPSTLGNNNSIAEASKAFRAKGDTAPVIAESAINTEANAEPAAGDDRPRNADGTFAKTEGSTTEEAAPVEGEAEAEKSAEGESTEETAPAEPKVFKLAGEPQRGEEDIELDVSDLPPEVLERLDRLEKRGMRRKEYDTAMNRVSKLESDQLEVETLLRLNPEGFVLDHLAPATRLKVGAAILLEHWDEFAPDIEAIWNDEGARFRALTNIRNGVQTRSGSVQREVENVRTVSALKRAIATTIPDGTDQADSIAYRAAAEALIASHIESNPAGVTPDTVPTLLASLAERYGFAQSNTKPATPARPKLAILKKDAAPADSGTRQNATLAATVADNGVPTIPSMSPDRFAEKAKQKQAARNVAPQGAGAQQVKRPGPPENATIEEASKWYRTHGAA